MEIITEPQVVTTDITTNPDGTQSALMEVAFPLNWIMGRQFLWFNDNSIQTYGRIDNQTVRFQIQVANTPPENSTTA